ncbi:MAG: hypothetical protein J6Z01_15190, partial [Bacteroidales bacterium]|nr:hypothetical protein [Bacteroidales bacterium]
SSMNKSKLKEIPPHGHTLCAYNDKGNCQIFKGLDCPMNFFEPNRMCRNGKIGTLEHSLANYNHDYTVATGKEPPVSEGLAMWMVLFNTKKQ